MQYYFIINFIHLRSFKSESFKTKDTHYNILLYLFNSFFEKGHIFYIKIQLKHLFSVLINRSTNMYHVLPHTNDELHLERI